MQSAFRPFAVVPAKALARAKSRLERVLSPRARSQLARELLVGVLRACRDCDDVAGTLVMTDGDDVATLAAQLGARVTRDAKPARASLSGNVDAALCELDGYGASHALIVMADLPLLRARDVRELVACLRQDAVVLAPDLQRRGTSALGFALGRGLRTAFGHPDSMQRHVLEAQAHGVPLRLIANPRIAFDLDTPADLARLRRVVS